MGLTWIRGHFQVLLCCAHVWPTGSRMINLWLNVKLLFAKLSNKGLGWGQGDKTQGPGWPSATFMPSFHSMYKNLTSLTLGSMALAALGSSPLTSCSRVCDRQPGREYRLRVSRCPRGHPVHESPARAGDEVPGWHSVSLCPLWMCLLLPGTRGVPSFQELARGLSPPRGPASSIQGQVSGCTSTKTSWLRKPAQPGLKLCQNKYPAADQCRLEVSRESV